MGDMSNSSSKSRCSSNPEGKLFDRKERPDIQSARSIGSGALLERGARLDERSEVVNDVRVSPLGS